MSADTGKSYRQLLRRIRRELKYELKADLIGTVVTIAGPKALEENVVNAIKGKVPNVGKLTSGGFSGKYDLLDLVFELAPPGDCPAAGLRLLMELGLLTPTRAEALEELEELGAFSDFANSGLELVDAELDLNRLILCLYLLPVKMQLTWIQKANATFWALVDKLRMKLSSRSRTYNFPLIRYSFPVQYCIHDACITNAKSIWFDKHSYL